MAKLASLYYGIGMPANGDLEKGMWATGSGSEAIQAVAVWCLLRASVKHV